MGYGFPQGYEPGKVAIGNKEAKDWQAGVLQPDYTGVTSNTPNGPGNDNKFKFGYPERKPYLI